MRRYNKAMNTMIEDPAIRKRLEELGLEILPPEQRTPEYLAKYLPQEVERWKQGHHRRRHPRGVTNAQAPRRVEESRCERYSLLIGAT